MFEDSPVTKKILGYFSTRIGQYEAPISHLKVLSIHSAGSNYLRLPMLHEARSKEFKSVTTKLTMRMFENDSKKPQIARTKVFIKYGVLDRVKNLLEFTLLTLKGKIDFLFYPINLR